MILGEDYIKYRCDNCPAEAFSHEAYRGAGATPSGWMVYGTYGNNTFYGDVGIHLCPKCADETLFREIAEKKGVSLEARS